MNQIQEFYLPSFPIMVKNRLGPYNFVIKIKQDDLKYYGNCDYLQHALLQKDHRCWIFRDQAIIGNNQYQAYLTTAAGDIPISRDDFKPGSFTDYK